MQDVLLRAQQRWERIGVMAARDAYVRRMVVNEYLSWRRRRAARTVVAPHAALLLRYYGDRTFDEIAEILGCSAGTVRSHLSRALGTLRTSHHEPVREFLSRPTTEPNTSSGTRSTPKPSAQWTRVRFSDVLAAAAVAVVVVATAVVMPTVFRKSGPPPTSPSRRSRC